MPGAAQGPGRTGPPPRAPAIVAGAARARFAAPRLLGRAGPCGPRTHLRRAEAPRQGHLDSHKLQPEAGTAAAPAQRATVIVPRVPPTFQAPAAPVAWRLRLRAPRLRAPGCRGRGRRAAPAGRRSLLIPTGGGGARAGLGGGRPRSEPSKVARGGGEGGAGGVGGERAPGRHGRLDAAEPAPLAPGGAAQSERAASPPRAGAERPQASARAGAAAAAPPRASAGPSEGGARAPRARRRRRGRRESHSPLQRPGRDLRARRAAPRPEAGAPRAASWPRPTWMLGPGRSPRRYHRSGRGLPHRGVLMLLRRAGEVSSGDAWGRWRRQGTGGADSAGPCRGPTWSSLIYDGAGTYEAPGPRAWDLTPQLGVGVATSSSSPASLTCLSASLPGTPAGRRAWRRVELACRCLMSHRVPELRGGPPKRDSRCPFPELWPRPPGKRLWIARRYEPEATRAPGPAVVQATPL